MAAESINQKESEVTVKATIRTGTGDPAAPSTSTAAESDTRTVKDAKGRAITVRRLSVLEEMRLLKVLGEHNSSYYSLCSQIARVSAIDSEKIFMPNSEREIETLGQRLGHEGIAALMEAISAPNESDEAKDQELVKKS
jgi:ABC-type Fe3+-hydroxamate transport system substrate-binding protein